MRTGSVMRLRARVAVQLPGTVLVGTVIAGMIVGSGLAHAAPSSAAATRRISPCSVLDSGVIGETLGGDATSPTRAGENLCRWFVTGAVADTAERTVVLVSIERYRGLAKRDIAQNSEEPTAVEVSGLPGAKFAFYDLTVVPPTITVVAGSRLFVVQMNALDTRRATVDALTTLAEQVLERL